MRSAGEGAWNYGDRTSKINWVGGFLVFLACFVWLYTIPSIQAKAAHSFTAAEVRARALQLGLKNAIAEDNEQQFEAAQTRKLQSEVVANLPGAVENLVRFSEYKTNRRPFATFGSCEYNFLSDILFVAYLTAFLLVTVMRPALKGKPSLLSAAIWGLILYTVLYLPNWVRATQPDSVLRRNTSYTHWDINPGGFLLQEARGIIWFLVIGLFLVQQYQHYKEVIDRCNSAIKADDFGELSNLASRIATRWVAYMFLVSVSFLPLTYFYWYTVSFVQDKRYIVSGVMVQLIWAVCTFVASLTFIAANRAWTFLRDKKLADAFNAKESDSVDRKVTILLGSSPFSNVQVLVSLIAVLLSFIFPLVQLVKK